MIAHLSDEDIQKIVQDTPDPQDACKKIVDLTNERGGSDNISLIILSKSSHLEDEPNKMPGKPMLPEFFQEKDTKNLDGNKGELPN